jgi:NitT/TauT family transport system substrate-binding protein
LGSQREVVKKFAEAHAALTDWMTKNPEEAQKLIKAELLAETRTDMNPDLIAQSWKRIVFTAEAPRASIESFLQNSLKTGFIKTAPDLTKLFEKP